MLKHIFRKPVAPHLLFDILEQCCLKTDKYYVVDVNAFRKMLFHGLHETFLGELMDCYHTSKQFYLTRKLTYNSFTNIVRQICKNNSIMFTSQIKYNESQYTIDYFVYF